MTPTKETQMADQTTYCCDRCDEEFEVCSGEPEECAGAECEMAHAYDDYCVECQNEPDCYASDTRAQMRAESGHPDA